MAAEDVLRNMQTRMSWTIAGQILANLGLSKSLGWQRTIEQVEAGDRDYETAIDRLTDALEEHLISAEKLTRFFKLEDSDMTSLRDAINDMTVPRNAFSQSFPQLLDEGSLANFRGHPPYIAAKLEYDHGTAIALASSRYVTSRESIHPAELPIAAAAELEEFEEIICIRHKRLQGIDVLWVPYDDNIIEVRTDFPLGMPTRSAEALADQAVNNLSHTFGANIFLDQINLFPAIQLLYDARGNGRMVELGFMTSGAAQKLEKTRRDLECCREEAYHLGGVEALHGPILPFRTNVLWHVTGPNGVVTEPEISLKGISVQTADPNAFLGDMIVRNSTSLADYEYARDQVLALLRT